MENKSNTLFNPSDFVVKAAAPFVLFVLCCAIRLFCITAQDICIDEPFSIYHAQGSLADIIHFLKPTNNPPLFEIILHYWIKFFGISPFSVRLLPVIFGSLAVIFIYKIGAKFFSLAVGVCASLLYCFSTHAIYYAHDCRTYTLFLFLCTASVYYFLRLISGKDLKSNLTAWVFASVLLIFSHYFGLILLFVQFISMLFFARAQMKTVLIGFVLVALFYSPQLFILINRFLFSTSEGTWVKEPVGIESIYDMFRIFSNMPLTAVVCLLLVVVSVIVYFKRNRSKNAGEVNDKLIYMFFFLPFFLMFFISFRIPVYNGRYLFFLIPFYYLSLAVMIFKLLKKERLQYILMAVLVILFIVTVQLNPDKKRESKAVTEFIKQNKQPGDLVIICTHEFLTNFAYYYNTDYFKTTSENEYEALELKLHNENIYPVRSINEVDKTLLESTERIIYLDAGADFSNPENEVLTTLEKGNVLLGKTKFKEIFTVYAFKRIN